MTGGMAVKTFTFTEQILSNGWYRIEIKEEDKLIEAIEYATLTECHDEMDRRGYRKEF
jgi:hypothetical protein